MATRKKTKTRRAGVRKPTRRHSPTAAKARGTARRPVFEVWATKRRDAPLASGTYGVCLWGTQADAEAGCDTDEDVCLLRVEVLEVLDES